MPLARKLLIPAAAGVCIASLAGLFLIDDDSEQAAPRSQATTTTTFAEIPLSTLPGSGSAESKTTLPSSDVTVLPVEGGPATTRTSSTAGRTSTTAPDTTPTTTPRDVPGSATAAGCPSPPGDPAAGAPVPAIGITTVAADGRLRHLSKTGKQPAFRSSVDQVLHIETEDGKDPTVCARAPDGSSPRALSTPAGADEPVLSPDGDKIAMRAGVGSASVKLAVGPVDSTSREAVLDGTDVTQVTWLGNATVVACFTPVGQSARIVKVAVTGGPPTTIRDTCSAPTAATNDGSRLAVPMPGGIDVIETASGKVTTLPRTGLVGLPPTWSPDGNLLAYGYTAEDGTRNMDVFDVSKALATRIFRGEADRPVFSPKGDRIVFTGRQNANEARQILSIAPTGGVVTKIATCAGRCLLPRNAFSGDGKQLVVDSTPA